MDQGVTVADHRQPTKPLRVAILGAGLSGRGFLARLLIGQAHVTLLDKDHTLIEALQAEGGFMVRHFDGSPMQRIVGYQALWTGDPNCVQALGTADVLLCCVRAENGAEAGTWIAGTAPVPIPVVACENAVDPAAALRMSGEWQVDSGAIFCTTVHGDGLDILSEDVEELVVSNGAAGRLLSSLQGFRATASFPQLMMRKIYTYNAASAIIAYLGAKRGYTIFSQAACDQDIDRKLDDFYREINRALCREYGVAPDEQDRFAQRSKDKFQNPYIRDDVARNAASPERKLSAKERIIAPASLIRKHGGNAAALVETAAAALEYAGYTAETARDSLRRITGLDEHDPLHRDILDAMQQT